MNISYNWLKEYLDFDLEPEEVAAALTSIGLVADLMRAVSIPCSIDFMVVSSYGGSNTVTSGLVKIIKDLDGDLSGKDVLIVEIKMPTK